MSHRPDYIPDNGDGNSAIAKEGYFDRERKKNDMQKKLHELVQADEQKSINKHSEGYCYGCTRKDMIISSLFYACARCMYKRGRECLLTLVYHKPGEEICDFCGKWQRPFDCWQINASLCTKCMSKVSQFHLKYRKAGGKKNTPWNKKQQRRFGNDWRILQQTSARKINL